MSGAKKAKINYEVYLNGRFHHEAETMEQALEIKNQFNLEADVEIKLKPKTKR